MKSNNIQYFAGLKDQKEIKKRWRELVLENHPDKGGDTATMQEINSQYENVMRGHYQKDNNEDSVDWWMEQEGLLFDIISKVVILEGVEVELLGVWVWVSGEGDTTKKHKEILKEIGFRWSKQKKAWYWRSSEHSYRRKNAPTKSLDDLRNGFGAKKAGKGKGPYKLTTTKVA